MQDSVGHNGALDPSPEEVRPTAKLRCLGEEGELQHEKGWNCSNQVASCTSHGEDLD